MCFLALIYKIVAEYPVVVAANRDEYLDRPGRAPLEVRPGIIAGQDPRAGGTWLGVSAGRLVVGVTNLPTKRPKARARSRGLLCMDLLGLRSAAEFPGALKREVATQVYNAFNVLAADGERAYVGTFQEGKLRVNELGAGVHIIANTLPDAGDDPKVLRGRGLIGEPGEIGETMELLKRVCGDHGERGDGTDAICMHGTAHGTLSSSIVALQETDQRRSRHLYAGGNPCIHDYQDISYLLGRGGKSGP